MFTNTEKKYSPKSLDEFVFPDEYSRELVTAYASGQIERPLVLFGTSGTGKSLLQRLIPNAIEQCEAQIRKILCAKILSAKDIHDLYYANLLLGTAMGENKKFNYIVIEEFLITNRRINDALKIELEHSMGNTLTLISTNYPHKIDPGILSRAEVLELKPCSPHQFFPHAKKIFQAEGVNIDDDKLLKYLEVTYAVSKDNRKYYQMMDRLLRSY